MIPFLLEITNKIGLYQLADGRFQLTQEGTPEAIMIGYEYIIVRNDIADAFTDLCTGGGLSFRPAIIWDRKKDKEYNNYREMMVEQHFGSQDLNALDLNSKQFLVMDNRYLFVTPALKESMVNSRLDFEFSEGLSFFG
ncbi:hypothetical protein [Hahella ganghwensis]|uniref:hypothetical protein n=1 Tax=Hahella ganghwensis TaxID=286420 RepID=UPI000361F350|nr:hypothetical protein [Hahella ganghwensis]